MYGLLHVPYYHQPEDLPEDMRADLMGTDHPADAETVFEDWRERHYVDPRLWEFLWERTTGRLDYDVPQEPTCSTCAHRGAGEEVSCELLLPRPFMDCSRWENVLTTVEA